MSDFSITTEQRQRLLNGVFEPLDFDTKPFGCEEGATYVLSYSRAKGILCDDGHVIQIPKAPVWYITVTKVLRHRKGFWRVQFDVTDRRDPDLYLRRTPPVMAPDEDGGDEDARARRESSYQTTRWGSVDDVPTVPRDWLEGEAKKASARDADMRLERSLQARSDRLGREWKKLKDRKKAA